MKVILVMAVTLDGKIGRHALQPVDWTGSDDKKNFVKITRKAGVIIMGSRTFDTIGKVLPGRLNIVMTRNSERRSLDENLIFTDKQPQELLENLKKNGHGEVALIGGSIINTLFARAGLIDEVYVTLVPRLFGQGLSLFEGELDLDLSLMDVDRISSDTLLLRYLVVKNNL